MIPYGRQHITDDDIAAVEAVLRSPFLTQGPVIPRFEEAVATRCGAAHAVATNSATSCLHIACLALGLGPGDRLWTIPNSFVASSNCGLYCGATVDFVDVAPGTWMIDPQRLAAKLDEAAASGTLPKILIPVHFSGQAGPMAEIAALCRPHGIKIIEDASHCIGASYTDAAGTRYPVGACAHSDICVFSFHPVKIITTGEGGVATTQDPELAARMSELRTHGITRDPTRMAWESDGPWYYQMTALGYNYRMTDMAAALGLSQMERLDEILDARLARADIYDAAFEGWALTRPERLPGARSAWHLYVVCLHDTSLRRAVFEGLRDAEIGVNVHYIPIHLQPFYQQLGFKRGDFPVAEAYYDGALTLPLYPQLTGDEQRYVIDTLGRLIA